MGDNFTRFDDEDPYGFCEFGKLMVVVKDLKAEATFQLENLFAQGGLADVQPFGCS